MLSSLPLINNTIALDAAGSTPHQTIGSSISNISGLKTMYYNVHLPPIKKKNSLKLPSGIDKAIRGTGDKITINSINLQTAALLEIVNQIRPEKKTAFKLDTSCPALTFHIALTEEGELFHKGFALTNTIMSDQLDPRDPNSQRNKRFEEAQQNTTDMVAGHLPYGSIKTTQQTAPKTESFARSNEGMSILFQKELFSFVSQNNITCIAYQENLHTLTSERQKTLQQIKQRGFIHTPDIPEIINRFHTTTTAIFKTPKPQKTNGFGVSASSARHLLGAINLHLINHDLNYGDAGLPLETIDAISAYQNKALASKFLA